MELLQDSDPSSVTIGPHWPSSYPEYLSPYQDKDEQRRVVWTRLLNQRSNLASRLSKQNERYQALRQELNPRTTQVGSSHDPLYCDIPRNPSSHPVRKSLPHHHRREGTFVSVDKILLGNHTRKPSSLPSKPRSAPLPSSKSRRTIPVKVQ